MAAARTLLGLGRLARAGGTGSTAWWHGGGWGRQRRGARGGWGRFSAAVLLLTGRFRGVATLAAWADFYQRESAAATNNPQCQLCNSLYPALQVLRWFWLLVGAMREEQRCALLRFWTSLPCLPEGGFGALPRRLCIIRADPQSQPLPVVRGVGGVGVGCSRARGTGW